MIGLQGEAQLVARLNALKGSPRGILSPLADRHRGRGEARRARKTGHLGRSIRAGGLFSDHASVEASVNYAAFVEYGTRAHIIRPRNGGFLRFAANGHSARLTGSVRRGGTAVFAREVHHPGTRPHPFLVPGARAALTKVGLTALVDEWNKAA
jgi:hypothetical protein